MGKMVEGFIEWKSTPVGRGAKEEVAIGDLIAWLSAVHVAQLDAGERYDYDGWDFFLEWYKAIGQ